MSKQTVNNKRFWRSKLVAGEEVLCALCGQAIPRKATGRNRLAKGGKGGFAVDHIIPKSRGGPDSFENLQPAHLLCNNLKGNKMPSGVSNVGGDDDPS